MRIVNTLHNKQVKVQNSSLRSDYTYLAQSAQLFLHLKGCYSTTIHGKYLAGENLVNRKVKAIGEEKFGE